MARRQRADRGTSEKDREKAKERREERRREWEGQIDRQTAAGHIALNPLESKITVGQEKEREREKMDNGSGVASNFAG